MPPDSVKYFRHERGHDLPPTLIDRREYENATRGCSKGISRCDFEYKKQLKYARSQFKHRNPLFMDASGKLLRPPTCKVCSLARDFSKSCEIQYENQFYGYAKESESSRTIYFHWSNNWHPNCGTSKKILDGRLVPMGVPDKRAYDDLFKLSVKPDNQKVKTPKVDEFISGYIQENKSGPYKGRLQWTKWFRHSLTFANWTKITKSAFENKAMQVLVNQPKMLIARMIYDQNMLIPEMDSAPKTPFNCEPISQEHWILAAISMVAFLGIRPKDRKVLGQYGGISKVGEIDFFTFLEHIDKPDELIRLTMLPQEEEPIVPLRMHLSDFTQKIHDDTFWSVVSDTFKNVPFKRMEKPIGQWKRRSIGYGFYKDNQSVEHLPYHNSAPYYNGAHAYDPSRYIGMQTQSTARHHEHYDSMYINRPVYPMMPMAHGPVQQRHQYGVQNDWSNQPVEHFMHSFDSASGSRKRSNSSLSDFSENEMLEQNLEKFRKASRKVQRISSPRYNSRGSRVSRISHFSASELRQMIMEDVRKESKKNRKAKHRRRRKYESESESSRSSSPSSRPLCREDSGREDNGRRRATSIESVASTMSNYHEDARHPTYDELLQQVKEMEKEKEEQQVKQAIERRQKEKSRWKTESSDSSDSEEF